MKLSVKLAVAGFAIVALFVSPAMSAPVSVFPNDLLKGISVDSQALQAQARAAARGTGVFGRLRPEGEAVSAASLVRYSRTSTIRPSDTSKAQVSASATSAAEPRGRPYTMNGVTT